MVVIRTEAFAGPKPRTYLRTKAAAAYLQCAVSTLAKRRCSGDGPAFVKSGRIVLYDVADLDAWAEQQKRQSTSGDGGDA
ncbi:MAG: helix-turn-helix domain-containing protein [Parvularcula sp.]|jgi:hypothetical protein|nr:helix-turn-helix domain-containing protein [Parvularcula sp.]